VDDESDSAPPDESAAAHAAQVSSDANAVVDDIDDLLNDVDESLHASLGFEPGEIVDPAEVEERAKKMVGQYVQKGGQ
jgi:hypothetical protein